MTDILILIVGIAVAYIAVLGFVLRNAPTMKDIEDLENEEDKNENESRSSSVDKR